MLHPTDDADFSGTPQTDLSIRVVNGEIRIIGTENDLDLLIPALCAAFVVSKVSKRYPRRRDEPHRATVYLTIEGIRKTDE